MKDNITTKLNYRMILYSFVIGFIAVIACYRVVALFNMLNNPRGWILLPFCFFLAAASVPMIFPGSKWKCIIPMLGSIPFAIVLDSTYDFYVNHIDRNLFPLEILFWLILTSIPAFIGYWTGLLIRKRIVSFP